MDRGHSATYAGDNHLLEYWEEYQKMIEETKMLDDYLDEECSPRSYDGSLLMYIIKLYLREKFQEINRTNLELNPCPIL